MSVLLSSSVVGANLDQDRSRMYDFPPKVSSNFPAQGLCIPNSFMRGYNIQSSDSIIAPLTTSRENVLLAPQLHPLPHSPTTKPSVNSIPLSTINNELQRHNLKAGEILTGFDKTRLATGGSNISTSKANIRHIGTNFETCRTREGFRIMGPGEVSVACYAQNSTNSSTIAIPAHHFNFPFPNQNAYSRQFIHMQPNYPMMAHSNGIHNPTTTTAAQTPSCITSNFANSLRIPYTSSSSTPSNAFPFHPPLQQSQVSLLPQHSLSIPPPIRECPSQQLFTGVYNPHSPVTMSSTSPNRKSPPSGLHWSSLSHHSSSLDIIKNGKSVTFDTASSSNSRSNIGEKIVKHRVNIQSSEHHQKNAEALTFFIEKQLNSNSIPNNANLHDHKLQFTTPKQKPSPFYSTFDCSPKLTSQTQPGSLPMQPAKSHFMVNETNVKNCAKIMCSVHFNKGSTIQLPNGSFKCVEDLSIDDFVKSAKESENLQIDSSTVVNIDIHNKLENNEMAVTLSLAVGVHKLQVSVEAILEQPWFVLGKGWSSCCPSKTLQRFSLFAHQLSVGDVCVSLTRKQNGRHFPTTTLKSGRKRRYSE